MASAVEISRLALGHIADAARVNSITPPDNTIQAQHCATFYPLARDECLVEAPWPFARRRTRLAQSLVALPCQEWAFSYHVPHGFLRALRVTHPGAPKDQPGLDYTIESDEQEQDLLLFTNTPDAILHYIYREEETGRYSPLFVSALAYLLGSYLAGPILKGRVGMQVKQTLYQMYQQLVDKAVTRDVGGAGQNNQNYSKHAPLWVSDR